MMARITRHWFLGMAAVCLLMIMGVAGCGGGVQATPTPAPTPTPIDMAGMIQQVLQSQPAGVSAEDMAKAVSSAMAQQPGVTAQDMASAIQRALSEQPGVTQAEVASAIASALAQQPGVTAQDVASAIQSAMAQQPGVTQEQVVAAIASGLAQQPGVTQEEVAAAIANALADQPGVTEEQLAAAIEKAVMQAMPDATPVPTPTQPTGQVVRRALQETAIGYGITGPAIRSFGEPVYGGVVPIQYWAQLRNWNPHEEFRYISSIYSPVTNALLQFNPFTFDRFDIWGDLAESWSQVDDAGQVWEFKIKDHAKFHDGSDVTAADVVYSFERMLGRTENHPGKQGEAGLFVSPHYDFGEVVDTKTVRLHLLHPWADVINYMADDIISILPQHVYEDLDAKTAAGDDQFLWDAGADNLVGSGPYTPIRPESRDTWTYERNPNYWKKDPEGRDLPYADGHTYFRIAGVEAAEAAWEAEQVYGTSTRTNGGMTPAQAQALFDRSGGKFIGYLTPCCPRGLLVNTTKAPFDDIRVRRALFLAMDRQEFNELTWGGLGVRGSPCGAEGHPLCISSDEVDKLPGYRQPKGDDVAAARALMREAGYEEGFQVKMVVAATGAGRSDLDTAPVLKDQLKRFLGVDLLVEEVDFLTKNQMIGDGDFDIIQQGSGAGVITPDTYLNWFFGFQSINNATNKWTYTLPNGRSIQDLILEQSQQTDIAKRREIVAMIEDITMTKDSHWIHLFTSTFFQMFNADRLAGQMPTQSGYVETKMEQLWLYDGQGIAK